MAGMKSRINAKELRAFQAKMSKLSADQCARFTRGALKDLAARLLRKAVARTPVDTGHLRQSWDVGAVVKNGDVYEIEVSNRVEYAPYVEFGHRTANHGGWVNGKFMLTVSEAELQADAPRILMNRLNRLIKGTLK
jgi:HK97 gp10 family phage protein